MTVPEITKEVNEVKKVTARQVYRYLHDFEIRPVSPKGHRQIPQHYPDDAAARIISELGLGVVTLNTMRAARRKSQKARAA